MYNNLIEIHDRLSQVYQQLYSKDSAGANGYFRCLTLLEYAINKTESINLHIENNRLRKELKTTLNRFDDWIEDKSVVHRKNKLLMTENILLRANIKAYQEKQSTKESIKAKSSTFYNLVEIDYEGEIISFQIDTDSKIFLSHFKKATDYAYERKSKKNKKVRLQDVKCWYLEYYRSTGFNCIA